MPVTPTKRPQFDSIGLLALLEQLAKNSGNSLGVSCEWSNGNHLVHKVVDNQIRIVCEKRVCSCPNGIQKRSEKKTNLET